MDLNQPLELKLETQAVLDQIRNSTKLTVLHGLDPLRAEQKLWQVTGPLLHSAGLRQVILNQYRWYVRELAGLYRERYGNDLAFNIELVIRKWLGFGLEPNTMQYLLCEIHRRLQQAGADPNDPGPV